MIQVFFFVCVLLWDFFTGMSDFQVDTNSSPYN